MCWPRKATHVERKPHIHQRRHHGPRAAGIAGHATRPQCVLMGGAIMAPARCLRRRTRGSCKKQCEAACGGAACGGAACGGAACIGAACIGAACGGAACGGAACGGAACIGVALAPALTWSACRSRQGRTSGWPTPPRCQAGAARTRHRTCLAPGRQGGGAPGRQGGRATHGGLGELCRCVRLV